MVIRILPLSLFLIRAYRLPLFGAFDRRSFKLSFCSPSPTTSFAPPLSYHRVTQSQEGITLSTRWQHHTFRRQSIDCLRMEQSVEGRNSSAIGASITGVRHF
ncbi:hypothetical protein CDAR_590411 [Caerostris darwini]|uniref:Secreted protein n=1 Tax=Caerostris darwini TaxID=1538125 RepID=A0AAV4NNV4_9ARAC|nr:hypothetical protein CDAR_590411 [Caerostris darwini]